MESRTERRTCEQKEAKKAEIEQWRDAACCADIHALGHIWQADTRCQMILSAAIALATNGLPMPPVWRDVENNNVPITGIGELLTIAGAVAEQTQTAYAISWGLKAQVDAAETADELAAVIWPEGT